MSTPPPDPSKSDPPLPHRCSASERRDQRSRRGGSGPDNTTAAAGTRPPPPHHQQRAGGEPRMTLDEAVRLHRAARHGDDHLPEAILASGLPLPNLPMAGATGVLEPSHGFREERGGGGRRDDRDQDPARLGRPSAAGTPTADILEEARRVVEEVASTLRLGDRTRRAPGGGGRSSLSDPPRPRSSGRRRPRSPDPDPDRQ